MPIASKKRRLDRFRLQLRPRGRTRTQHLAHRFSQRHPHQRSTLSVAPTTLGLGLSRPTAVEIAPAAPPVRVKAPPPPLPPSAVATAAALAAPRRSSAQTLHFSARPSVLFGTQPEPEPAPVPTPTPALASASAAPPAAIPRRRTSNLPPTQKIAPPSSSSASCSASPALTISMPPTKRKRSFNSASQFSRSALPLL